MPRLACFGSGGSGGLSYEWTAAADGADWLSDAGCLHILRLV